MGEVICDRIGDEIGEGIWATIGEAIGEVIRLRGEATGVSLRVYICIGGNEGV